MRWGRRENSQRHLEEPRAERERSRLNTAHRLVMVRAVCERGEEQGKENRETEKQEQSREKT